MGYAIMKRLHETILTVKDPTKMIETLKTAGPSVISDSHYIINWGFKMALTRNNNSYTQQKALASVSGLQLDSKTLMMYKHKMDIPSSMVSDSDVIFVPSQPHIRWSICSSQFRWIIKSQLCSWCFQPRTMGTL